MVSLKICLQAPVKYETAVLTNAGKHPQGWLGGWLLPQEASYFALALPHGWWLFGLDLALVDDIDMCQCR